MLSKSVIIAVAASGLMAGAAFAQNVAPSTYPDKTLTPPDKIQDSPFSPNSTSSAPAATNDITPRADTGSQSNVSARVTEVLPSGATFTDELVTNGPVPDTAANRSKYGMPDSNAGKMTRPAGN